MRHPRVSNLLLNIITLLVVVVFNSYGPANTVAGTAHARTFQDSTAGLRVAVFDIDATPPVGSQLAYDKMVNRWDLGLRARGIVLLGAGQPIVLCAVDWLGICNEGMDEFKAAVAAAAATSPKRVTVNVLHQHDAPMYDPGAERILLQQGIDPLPSQPVSYEGSFARETIRRLSAAVRASIAFAQPVTDVGFGTATISQVASNRNIYGADGKVRTTRMSATKDASVRAEPEGVIDPVLSMISFWNKDKAVAVLSYYATHPQSYYRTGVANPDFPGVARFFRQLAVPDALHIHFNGAGGNIAAGKYNDGAHENRLILAERMAAGMKHAWESTVKQPVSADKIRWSTEPVAIPPAGYLTRVQQQIEAGSDTMQKNHDLARKMAWYNRCKAGQTIDLACLRINDARVLYMPGELFIEYQLAAKAELPKQFVAMGAYGDLGMGYIGTTRAYAKGGYEVSERASSVAPEVEPVLMSAIKKLLHQ